MRKLFAFALLVALAGSSCATAHHDAQATPRASRAYREAQRHHSRARHRAVPLYLPWN